MVMFICLALANIAGSTPAWALSADELLDLMVEEGAITPQKAQKIKEKARKLDERKKAAEEAKRARELQQVKQEAKTEAKAEAKAEAAKEAEAVVARKTEGWKLPELPEALKGLKIGILAYIDYSLGDRPTFRGPLSTPPPAAPFGRNISGHVGSSQWTLQRGYLNVEKEITSWLYARYTPDLFQDATGNWAIRQKYLYGELRPPDLGNVLTQMKNEWGLGHTPWHDFEESIWPYRCLSTTPIERDGVFSSADIGINIRGNFGGKLACAKTKVGTEAYDGRYGSWHVGVYNGCGYTATENNQNKVPEYRVSVRPLPDVLPGFQATYFGLYGKGNSSSSANYGAPLANYFPDWIVNMAYLSYQNPWVILSAQTFWSKGNQAGNWTTQPNGPGPVPLPFGRRLDSLWTRGSALYGDIKLPVAFSLPYWKSDHTYPLHVFTRFDWFDADEDHEIAENATFRRLFAGLAYYVYRQNIIVLSYERTWYGSDYGANFTRPGSIGSGGGVVWPSSTTATAANLRSNNGNLGTDQRFHMVFQVSY
jgi:polyhydroxyalkanoate synthesis regulator phasin